MKERRTRFTALWSLGLCMVLLFGGVLHVDAGKRGPGKKKKPVPVKVFTGKDSLLPSPIADDSPINPEGVAKDSKKDSSQAKDNTEKPAQKKK